MTENATTTPAQESVDNKNNNAAPENTGSVSTIVPTAEQKEEQKKVETPAAEAPKAEKPADAKKPKITVSASAPKKQGAKKDKKDFTNKREWIAKIRQQNQETLKNAGYKPDAIVEILRFMTAGEDKYPYSKGLKSPLIFMLTGVAHGLKYQTATWGSSDVSQLVCLLVEVNGVLSSSTTKVGDKKFSEAKGEECMTFIRKTFDDVWMKEKVSCNQNLARAKSAILRAINSPKHPESIGPRARYLLDCIIEITMNMVDPFTGVYHTEVVPLPEELKGKLMSFEELKAKRQQARDAHKPQYQKREPQMCRKCGKPLTWVKEVHRNICTNVMCDLGTTKEEAIERFGGDDYRRGKRPDGGNRPQQQNKPQGKKSAGKDEFHYRGGDKETSAMDKFKAKYAAKAAKPERTIAAAAPKSADGKTTEFGNSSVWGALDGLKLPDAPAAAEQK